MQVKIYNTYLLQYESTYSRTRNDAKKNEDKNVSSTLGGKYTYNTGYNRDNSTTKDTGNHFHCS